MLLLLATLEESVLVARASPVLPYYMLLGPSFWPRPDFSVEGALGKAKPSAL